MNLINVTRAPALLLSSVLLLSACGGGSDSSTETLTGVFIDAPVEGAGFQTASNQGTTNEKGEFTYQAGELISFFIQGIQIGSTTAQSKTPVTELPNSIVLARIIQTLDHAPEAGKIDLSGIVLDETTKNQLKAIIANEDDAPDLEDVLTDEKIAEIQTNSNVDLVNDKLVSASEAASHLAENIEPIAFAASDFSNQFIIDSDGTGLGSDLAVITLDSSGSGSYSSVDEDTVETDSFSVAVNTNGSVTFTTTDGNYTGTKLSQSGNRTVVHLKDLSDDDEFIREFYQALPLSLTDIDGKHLAMDTSASSSCSARTLSISGASITVKEICSGAFFSTTGTLSEHSQLDNVIVIAFPAHEGESANEVHLALVEGSVAEGQYGVMDYSYSVTNSLILSSIDIIALAETEAALTDPNFIEASDLANKLFVDSDGSGLGSDLAVITFDTSGTGVMSGQEDNGDGFAESFNWSANDDGTVTLTFQEGAATGTQVSQSGNRRVINVKESDGTTFNREWYEALPLSLADLNGKHFTMDTGSDNDCSARTLSFNGTVITVNERCSGGFFTFTGTAADHSQLDNVLIVDFTGQDRGPGKSHIALADGTLASGSYAAVEYDANAAVEGVYTLSLSETSTPISE